ncbi:hypothetical protein [Streptomyces sp. NPDC002133]|uniref:hypothetical protein n=1 Tax=Streptomyces sp. NPDC002133 TaxID=3154409 RepID=UPI0033326CCE
MGRLQAGVSSPERIRYRLTRLQRVLPVLPALLIVITLQIVYWSEETPDGFVVGAVVSPFVLLITSRGVGITLTQSAAIVHRVSRRTIPWADVQAVRIESSFGIRSIVIYEATGRRTSLPAPNTGFLSWDRTFEEKFHTIGSWWLDHRGPHWAPVLPPGAGLGGPPGPVVSGDNTFAPPA